MMNRDIRLSGCHQKGTLVGYASVVKVEQPILRLQHICNSPLDLALLKKSLTSQPFSGGLVKRILVQVGLLVLVVALIALVVRKAEGNGSAEPENATFGLSALAQQTTFCLQDVQTSLSLTFNTVNGAYTFKRCFPPLTLTGTGVTRTVNSTVELTDSKPDRRVSAGFLQGQNTGTATINILNGGVSQNFRINSSNPNAVCGACK